MDKTIFTKIAWTKRKARVRKKVYGTPERPRLTVFRSLNNIYAQVIDDKAGKTIVSMSTLAKSIRSEMGYKGNVTAAKKVGIALANACQTKGVTKVVFDRNGYLYHGRIKALAEAAREVGLEF